MRAVTPKPVMPATFIQDADLIPCDLRPRESACARCGYLLGKNRLVLLTGLSLGVDGRLRGVVNDLVKRVSLVHALMIPVAWRGTVPARSVCKSYTHVYRLGMCTCFSWCTCACSCILFCERCCASRAPLSLVGYPPWCRTPDYPRNSEVRYRPCAWFLPQAFGGR